MGDVYFETVYFTGHVQGVGFRYATLQIAREYDVAGFVSNQADGRVLVEAEGTKADLGAFIAAIEERMHGYVRKVERSGGKRPARLKGFAIR